MKLKLKGVMNAVSRTYYKVGFKCKKHAPEALVVAGVAGVVTSSVMACKATLKADEIIQEHKEQLDKIAESCELSEAYVEYDKNNDLRIVYTQTAVKFIKLYGPSVLLGGASIVCILGSHRILKKRNVALAAAYKIVDTNFKDYRNRVIERFGEELDKELRYNVKTKTIEEVTTDENGNEVITEHAVQTANLNEHSDYAKWFDETCVGWRKNPEDNLYTLRCKQNYANDALKKQGFLFLNDVYEMLGIPKTKAGQIVGWIYDEKHPIGDNYVDFGIYNYENERARAFVNGNTSNILLDFNVDGNILDLI